ncbi:MAG: hypothetical protein U1F68_13385 [Gammaproteobacteria bacterium]
MYILAENAKGLVLVDMHAAHERITYERLKANLAHTSIHSQPLLAPITVNLSVREVGWVEENAALFAAVGLEVHALGPETVVVRSVPALLLGADERLLREMIADLGEFGASRRVQDAIDAALATMARQAGRCAPS